MTAVKQLDCANGSGSATDVSPYFEIIKPSLAGGFDYRSLPWDASDDRELREGAS